MSHSPYMCVDSLLVREAYAASSPDNYIKVIAISNVLHSTQYPYPHGWCGKASYLLKKYLSSEVKFYHGAYQFPDDPDTVFDHCWVVDTDARVLIDLTAAQFRGLYPSMDGDGIFWYKFRPEDSVADGRSVLHQLGYRLRDHSRSEGYDDMVPDTEDDYPKPDMESVMYHVVDYDDLKTEIREEINRLDRLKDDRAGEDQQLEGKISG